MQFRDAQGLVPCADRPMLRILYFPTDTAGVADPSHTHYGPLMEADRFPDTAFVELVRGSHQKIRLELPNLVQSKVVGSVSPVIDLLPLTTQERLSYTLEWKIETVKVNATGTFKVDIELRYLDGREHPRPAGLPKAPPVTDADEELVRRVAKERGPRCKNAVNLVAALQEGKDAFNSSREMMLNGADDADVACVFDALKASEHFTKPREVSIFASCVILASHYSFTRAYMCYSGSVTAVGLRLMLRVMRDPQCKIVLWRCNVSFNPLGNAATAVLKEFLPRDTTLIAKHCQLFEEDITALRSSITLVIDT